MRDLVAFLTARLDEDEAVALAATPGPWRWGDWAAEFGTLESERNTLERAPVYGDFPAVRLREHEAEDVLSLQDPLEAGGENWLNNGAHIARHHPARVLAETAAKREVVGRCAPAVEIGKEHHGYTERDYSPWSRMALFTLRNLAAVYADHPDYEEDMR